MGEWQTRQTFFQVFNNLINYLSMKCKVTDEQFKEFVASSYSIAEVIRKCGLKPAGGNYQTINTKIDKLNLDTSHFTGKLWSKGKKLPKNYFGRQKPLEEILVKNSTYQSYKLAKRLIEVNLKEHKCERCKRTEWEGNPIPIELHHINGVHSDNRLENLQILCPNCHALTDNYRGKANTKI